MEFISRFILYLDNYFLLSNVSKVIIQWSLTGLIIFSLLKLFLKKVTNPTFSLYIGFAVRLALLIGLSLEMVHQIKVTELTEVYNNKMLSYRQFLHFMFFGYIIVVGFHYMITINQKKYKGLFYTFDIAVLTMPILQLITSFIFYTRIENPSFGEYMLLFIILIVTSVLIYMFFVSYWNKKLLIIISFYCVTILCIIPLIIGSPIVELVEIVNLYLFLGLLMTYHLLSTSEKTFIKKGKKSFMVITTIIFVILINPFHNIGHVALATTNAEVKLRYFDTTELVTLNEAKNIARLITGNDDFYLRQNAHEDFHNVYFFESDNYSVDVHGISGSVMNLHRKTKSTGRNLTKEEYIKKSKQLLHSLGRKLKDIEIHIEVLEENERVEIKMVPTLTDGTTIENQKETVFIWEKESLIEFHESAILYPLNSMKNISLTDKDIAKTIDRLYTLLKQKTPAYVLDGAEYGYSNRTIDLDITTSNDHFITIDGKTGEVKRFTGYLKDYKKLDFSKIESDFLKMKNIDVEKFERTREQNFWMWREKSNNESTLEFTHQFGYTKGEALFSYSENIDYLKKDIKKIKNSTREEAYNAVKKAIGNEKIYAMRAKLTQVIDKNDTIRDAWLIVVQPFGKAEHLLYLVDIDTQKVDVIYE